MYCVHLFVCVGFTVFIVNLHAEGECKNLMTSLRWHATAYFFPRISLIFLYDEDKSISCT